MELGPDDLRRSRLPRLDGDKNARGSVLVVGGCRQTPGAVLLAAEAALRLGAGKVQIATTASTATQLAAVFPEAYVEGLPESRSGDVLPSAATRILQLAESADAVLLGPGMSDPLASALLLSEVVPHLHNTVVLDALATAYLTPDLTRVTHLWPRRGDPQRVRAAATLRAEEDDVRRDPADAARTLARRRAPSSSVAPTRPTSRPRRADVGQHARAPGLATAGSGDVKAGALVAFCARGAGVTEASVWAVACHGLAGERLAARGTGFLARDVVRELPAALTALEAG